MPYNCGPSLIILRPLAILEISVFPGTATGAERAEKGPHQGSCTCKPCFTS